RSRSSTRQGVGSMSFVMSRKSRRAMRSFNSVMEQSARQDFEVGLEAAHPFVAARTPKAAPPDKNSRRDCITFSSAHLWKPLSSPKSPHVLENTTFVGCRLITFGSLELNHARKPKNALHPAPEYRNRSTNLSPLL